jgi:hypothetical protein
MAMPSQTGNAGSGPTVAAPVSAAAGGATPVSSPAQPEPMTATQVYRRVKVQPLSWHTQTPHRPGLVLGYAATWVSGIEGGISVLGQSYRDLPRAE